MECPIAKTRQAYDTGAGETVQHKVPHVGRLIKSQVVKLLDVWGSKLGEELPPCMYDGIPETRYVSGSIKITGLDWWSGQ